MVGLDHRKESPSLYGGILLGNEGGLWSPLSQIIFFTPIHKPQIFTLSTLWKIIFFHVLTPAPRPLWSNFHRNDGLPPNKSLLRIKIEFLLPVDKLIDLGALVTKSSPKHILIYHVRDCFKINSSSAWTSVYWGPVRAHSLPWNAANFLTELFQQLNHSMSVLSILVQELFAEVIIYNILLVNVKL
jgi:hypothetical protein